MLTSSSPPPAAHPASSRAPAPGAAPVPRPSRRDVEHALLTRSVPREHGFEPLRVEGALPPALRGTLLRNGPGQFEVFGRRVAHSFEADGLITAVRFDGAGAAGACRLTASAGRTAELAAGRMLHGTALPWPRRLGNALRGRQKNSANTNVISWQGRTLALFEAGRPTELAVTTDDVRTVGETDLGVIGPAFSAHPHRVAARHASYNFGVEYGRRTAIVLYELPDAGPARRLGAVELGFAPMLHDFIATARHLVFFVSPAAVDVPRMLLQLGDFRRMFRWQPERGTEVIIVPIDEPTRVTRFTVDAFYQWHFAAAFERGAELVVDYVRYPDFGSFELLAGDDGAGAPLGGQLHRAVIDVAGRRMTSEARLDREVEFPRVHPDREAAAHDVTWLVADGAQALVAHRGERVVDEFTVGGDEAVSEPVFVPRGGGDHETDGWLLTLIYDHARGASALAVLDAACLGDGPVARAWFDHHVPITFHGNFVPAA